MGWSNGGISSGPVGRRVRTDSIGAVRGAESAAGADREVFKAGSHRDGTCSGM